MSNQSKENLEKLLEYYKELLQGGRNKKARKQVLDSMPHMFRIAVLNLIEANAKALGYLLRKDNGYAWARRLKVNDIELNRNLTSAEINNLVKSAKTALSIWSKVKPTRDVVHVTSTKATHKAYKGMDVVLRGAIYSRCENKQCSKPFQSVDGEVVKYAYTFLQVLENDLSNGTSVDSSCLWYEQQAKNIISNYIDAWNLDDNVMKLKEEFNLSVYDRYGNIRLVLQDARGNTIHHYWRTASEWLLDGLMFEPYETFKKRIELVEFETCLKSPTLWITLDNYEHFHNGKDVRIEEISQKMLKCEDGSVKGISIQIGPDNLFTGRFVFYLREKDGSYRQVSSHKAEARNVIRQVKVLEKLMAK